MEKKERVQRESRSGEPIETELYRKVNDYIGESRIEVNGITDDLSQ